MFENIEVKNRDLFTQWMIITITWKLKPLQEMKLSPGLACIESRPWWNSRRHQCEAQGSSESSTLRAKNRYEGSHMRCCIRLDVHRELKRTDQKTNMVLGRRGEGCSEMKCEMKTEERRGCWRVLGKISDCTNSDILHLFSTIHYTVY